MFFHRNKRSVGSGDEASGQIQTVRQYKQHNDWLSKSETFNIAILFVCLSVALKFMNHVTDCYKSGVNIMMTLGGTTTA
jgi:hypothetical protein